MSDSDSNRRDFLKNAGQGALAAGIGLSLPEVALADTKANKPVAAKDNKTPWPYPVAYGKENEIEADVLILGGGAAGCHAAINAAKRGANVVLVEKAAVVRSGCNGPGVDHWHGVFTHPSSKLTPDDVMELARKATSPYTFCEYGNGITSYILFKESYDALLDVEEMGIHFRDDKDEFKGSAFRDEATKMMFAYDYDTKYIVRLKGGANIKLAYYKELTRLGVHIYDRVMATSLLTEGGEQGRRVIGATGLNTRTGEFYIFKAKATIMSASAPEGLWIFSTETKGAATHGDPNNAGDSTAMAWRAGAEMALMERSSDFPAAGGFAYPMFGVGNAANTWACCNIVDANGKEVPWVDRNGNILKTVEERYRLTEGQRMLFPGRRVSFDLWSPVLIPDLPERVKKGEYVLPLYADLPGMPPDERRAIWGLMLYNEGKTRIIYENYQEAGFDSDKDLLQAPVMPPDKYEYSAWWENNGPRQQRGGFLGGGLFFDWRMKTSLDGLYVAGESNYGGSDHALAATTGRYAARNAVAYAKTVKAIPVNRGQIEKEKARIYAPVMRTEGMGWKELRGGLARIMQDYLGEYKSKETLDLGLEWFKSARESELTNVHARNPHELWRTVECMSRIDCGELMMHASLNRKASSRILAFNRLDYPQDDPKEWEKIITVKLVNGEVKTGAYPVDYYLQAPYAPTYAENYRQHSGL